jgi:dCMP deaminase
MNSEADTRYMQAAIDAGRNSVDRSRKVGAVIVGPEGSIRAAACNSFPRGVRDIEPRHERPAKYLWTEHAERNAIYQAAKLGIPIDGCTIYVPWFPCMDCARAIVQSGIRRLVAIPPDVADPTWGEHFLAAIELFGEAGVKVDLLK